MTRRFLPLFIVAAMSFSGCATSTVTETRTSQPDTPAKAKEIEPTRISAEGIASSEPALAQDTNGGVFVVYVEHNEKDADVYLQKLDAARKPAGPKVRVNPKAGEAKAWRGDPPTIAIGPEGTIYIGWTRKYPDEGQKGNDLMLSESHDGGTSFGEPVRVNDDTKSAAHGMHSLAIDKQGTVFLAWLDERNVVGKPHQMNMDASSMHHEAAEPNSEVFYSMSTDGGKSFATNKKISSDVCPCCKTSLLTADDGTIYVGWRQVLEGDHRHIAVAHSSDHGTTFSSGVVVSNDNWQIDACPVSGAALASSTPNTIDVVWYTAGAAGQAGLYFTRSSDGGKTFGDRILVSGEAASGTPAILERDGKTFAVFPAIGGATITAAWSETPATGLSITRTDEAATPTAISGAIAFVRGPDGKNSVWVIPD